MLNQTKIYKISIKEHIYIFLFQFNIYDNVSVMGFRLKFFCTICLYLWSMGFLKTSRIQYSSQAIFSSKSLFVVRDNICSANRGRHTTINGIFDAMFNFFYLFFFTLKKEYITQKVFGQEPSLLSVTVMQKTNMNFFLDFFNWALSLIQRLSGTYSKSIHGPLLMTLWIEDSQI